MTKPYVAKFVKKTIEAMDKHCDTCADKNCDTCENDCEHEELDHGFCLNCGTYIEDWFERIFIERD